MERSWKGSGLPDTAKLAAAVKSDATLPAFPELSLIGQHHGTYLIAQNEDGLYLIDQHAAHERVNYEYYYEKFGNPAQASQELLLPITLEFTPSETEKLKSRLAWFEQAGVYLEHFGGQTFRVRSHPFWFPKGDEKDIIEKCLNGCSASAALMWVKCGKLLPSCAPAKPRLKPIRS